MKVIAFTGLPGSGKSEAVGVAEEAGFSIVRMGDEVRAEVERRGIPINDENLGGVANEMREKEGMDVWARRCLAKLKESMADESAAGVVIDGIRNIEEVEAFRQSMNDFILVAIHASPKTRYGRMMKRGREDDSMSIDDLKKRDARELSWGIGNVVAMADIIITNEGSLEEFRKKVKNILRQIKQD